MASSNSSTLKALDVLEMLAETDGGLRLTDVAQRSGFPISTSRRLLMSLIARGYVEQEAASGRYFLGTKVLTLQSRGTRHRQVARLAYPFLKRLQREVDETINLGILSGDKVVYIETLAPESSFSFYAPPGTQMPLHCTAMGKVFLAHLSPDALAGTLGAGPLPSSTPNTITDPAILSGALAEVRHHGYAVDKEEYALGVRCVAFPIYGHGGEVTAALSMTAPATRLLPEREATVIAALGTTCAEISDALGYRPA